jgi:hypothetical protein
MPTIVGRGQAVGVSRGRRLVERWLAAALISPWAVGIAVAVVLALLVLAGGYGWHRDELYFVIAGRHPAFGYPDQPSLTPILSAVAVAILGASPVAVRILPALAIGLAILLTADMARRFGGGARAQVVAAAALAASGYLFAGHLAATATFDLVFWTAIAWLVVRLLAGGDPRLWLALGVVGGLGFENKHLIVLLAAGLVAGLVLGRRWDVLRSPYAWLGAAVAIAVALPNVLWQVANDWPALDMAAAIARGTDDRGTFVVELLFLGGSFVVIIPIVGLLWLALRREFVAWRPLGLATLVVIALVVVADGKSYYVLGILGLLVAAGSLPVARWLDRGRTWLRPAVLGAATVASIVVVALATLPIVPAGSLASTPIPDLNREQGEQIGWPELVATVRAAVETLPAEDRETTVILTSNYGEAGAIEILGPDLPPVYSGHNGYWDWGPPADGRTVAILVGSGPFRASGVGGCTLTGTVRNEAGVRNQEWGTRVQVCRRVPSSFRDHWAVYRHLD